MKKAFLILLFIPLLGFNQYSTKYYTKKQEIKGLQRYTDSINSLLNAEIERLLENKEMHQLEIKKLHQQQAKLQLASKYLKQAKRKITIGNTVTGVTVLSGITMLIVSNNNTGQNNYAPDFKEIYLAGAAVLVFAGPAKYIPHKIKAKENIRKA
ncbi:MAG: hypothetical protein ACJ0QL_00300, partial [Parvicellaceae bacterium]